MTLILLIVALGLQLYHPFDHGFVDGVLTRSSVTLPPAATIRVLCTLSPRNYLV